MSRVFTQLHVRDPVSFGARTAQTTTGRVAVSWSAQLHVHRRLPYRSGLQCDLRRGGYHPCLTSGEMGARGGGGAVEVKKLAHDHTANRRQHQPLGLSDSGPRALCHLPVSRTVQPVPGVSDPATSQRKASPTTHAQGPDRAEGSADMWVSGPFLLSSSGRVPAASASPVNQVVTQGLALAWMRS